MLYMGVGRAICRVLIGVVGGIVTAIVPST